ncbi:DNA ligase D [Niabella insulamsoli]|uniref:DNA ligase D n=1 Tax=Niabella insulamsoli TaxID=3144874 RepID=UPI0031FD09A2
MLATLAKEPFDNPDWIFEIKWDGYRAIAETGEKLQLYSRNGISFLKKYTPIAEALQEQEHEMILDGEIVAYNEDHIPDFQTLQHFAENPNAALIYHVFDLLYLNGHDTKALSNIERKTLLREALVENDFVRYCDHVEKNGVDFFNAARDNDLEGMIAKRGSAPYTEGRRSGDWLKIKHHNTEEVVIAGFTKPRGGRQYFGALILGRYQNGELVYAGHTGTGFDEASLREISKKLKPLIRKQAPFAIVPKTNMPATWVKPELVCSIKYTELTNDHIFRHPVFMGLRIDKPAQEVIIPKNEKAMANKSTKAAPAKKAASRARVSKKTKTQDENDMIKKVQGKEVKLTNQSKIYWPDEGITKGDLINYYEKMSKYILPYLKHRPESLNRFPNGIKGSSFYQKDAGDTAPDWVSSIEVFSESNQKNIDYIICNDKATLLYLANLGCIEMNPWNSTAQKQDQPSYMIIDIDPGDKNTFEQVIETALATKQVLDGCGVKSYCKTSGASGLHVFVPMADKYDYEQVKTFAHLTAMKVVEMLPDFTTLERNLKKRGTKKIYVDYLQNRKGQTIASAYSVRPKKGATVSTPLDWKEVKKGLHPSQFDINSVPKRVAKIGDIFKPVLGRGADIMKCLKKMEG